MGSGFEDGVIKLNEEAEVYYSGQVIGGTVEFQLRQAVSVSGLYIRFVGTANVSWSDTETESVNGQQWTNEVEYKGYEEYFNYSYPLAGGNGLSQIPAGTHTFHFKYQIPFNAPSSFEGELGQVKYKVVTSLMYPDGIQKEEIIKEFNVVAPFNLREGSPEVREPVEFEFDEVYGCDCFGGSPVKIRLRLPVSGYCPGQAIPVGIEVMNESSVEIVKMIFELVTKERYVSQRPQSEFIIPAKVLTTTKTKPVMGHCKRNFTAYLNVPEFIPPYLENCGIIDVGYFIKVTIKLTGCNGDLEDESEICLGLVPLRETLDAQYIHPMAHSLPKAPIPDQLTPPDLTIPPNPVYNGNGSVETQQFQQNAPQNQYVPHPQTQNFPYPQTQNVPYPPTQNVPYPQTQNMPYPAPQNLPYPTYSTSYPYPNQEKPVAMEMKPIGFNDNQTMPMPQLGQYTPYPPAGAAPSAPPPSS